MKKRLTFDQDSVLSLLKIIDPIESLSQTRNHDSLLKLALYFPTLVEENYLDQLEDEWKGLLYAKESLKSFSELATSFWLELKTVKDGNNELRFPLLSKFMCSMLALPHSSACVERTFFATEYFENKTNKQALYIYCY